MLKQDFESIKARALAGGVLTSPERRALLQGLHSFLPATTEQRAGDGGRIETVSIVDEDALRGPDAVDIIRRAVEAQDEAAKVLAAARDKAAGIETGAVEKFNGTKERLQREYDERVAQEQARAARIRDKALETADLERRQKIGTARGVIAQAEKTVKEIQARCRRNGGDSK